MEPAHRQETGFFHSRGEKIMAAFASVAVVATLAATEGSGNSGTTVSHNIEAGSVGVVEVDTSGRITTTETSCSSESAQDQVASTQVLLPNGEVVSAEATGKEGSILCADGRIDKEDIPAVVFG